MQIGVKNIYKLFLEVKSFGYSGSYASVYRYLKFKVKELEIKNYKPSIRFETGPGQQAQVDWGSFGKIEIDDKIERLYCFVYVLGYSRAMYIEFTIKQNLQTLEECHINAFEELGIPEIIVYDNMKTVVLSREKLPDGKVKPHLNPAFLDFAQFYGFKVHLCSPYWPRAKGKVESGVKYVRNNFMQGMKFGKSFKSLQELNFQALVWLKNVANLRNHGTTGEIPVERWQREKDFLHFPNDFPKYEISPTFSRSSTKDGLIRYKSNFYSIPVDFSRKKLFVKEINNNGLVLVGIYYQDKMIASHPISSEKGKWVINRDHFLREPSLVKDGQRKRYKKQQIGLIKKPVLSRQTVYTRGLNYYDQLLKLKK